MKFARAHISLEGSPVSVQLNFPRFLLAVISVFKRVVQLSLLVLVINLLGNWIYQHFTQAAKEQRNQLYSKLENLNAKIDSVDTKISKSYSNENLLYAKFGLMAPDTSMREMGFGGAILSDSALVWSALPIRKLKFYLKERVQKTQAKIDRSNKSYSN
jgi:hypothetical protein